MKWIQWVFPRAGILLSILLIAGEASAQIGGVRGKCVDENGNPIQGVEVTLEMAGGGRTYTTETDEEGEFIKGGMRVGPYLITYDYEGREQVKGRITVTDGKPQYLDEVTMAKLPEGVLTEKSAKVAQAHVDAAMAASNAEDYQGTIDSLKKFLEMVPNNAEAYFNIGAAYEKMGDKDNALANYRKATELAPDMYDAWLATGDLCGSMELWQEGMEALGKALELQPDVDTVLFNYGAYAFNAGDTETARGAFEKLVAANPDHALGHYRLGLVNVGLGNKEEAIEHINKYLELEPQGGNVAAASELLKTLNQN